MQKYNDISESDQHTSDELDSTLVNRFSKDFGKNLHRSKNEDKIGNNRYKRHLINENTTESSCKAMM